jgi:thiamine pyrophosphate-dependent acetolactate synthase large subunit-like protein
LDETAKAALRDADVIVSLDAIDFAGVLEQAFGDSEPDAMIVSITLDRYAARGWTMDMGGVARIDVDIAAHPDAAVPLVLAEFSNAAPAPERPNVPTSFTELEPAKSGPITMASLGSSIRRALGDEPFTLTRLPLGWTGDSIPFIDPLSYLGYDGGGGVGSGPGMAVGSALALKAAGRLPVAILGDGDFLMGCTALWTAVAHDIPLLVIIANNRVGRVAAVWIA